MTNTTLETFTTDVQRLYSLERTLISVLDVLSRDVSIDSLDNLHLTACRDRLQERIETHRDETETHLERLESVFDSLEDDPSARATPELDGWVSDKERFNNILLNDELRPLYYLDAMKKLEAIERSAYEPVLALAERLEDGDGTERELTGFREPLERNDEDERDILSDLDSIAESDALETLLEASSERSNGRSSLDRSRTRERSINIETLEDVFVYQLWNVYDIETALLPLLEDLVDTDHDDLGDAVADYQDTARTHVERLEAVFDALGPRPSARTNHTFDGVAESHEARIAAVTDDRGQTDLIILETARTVARLERECYDELLTMAQHLEYSEAVVDPLADLLEEERETVDTLEGLEYRDLVRESLAAEN